MISRIRQYAVIVGGLILALALLVGCDSPPKPLPVSLAVSRTPLSTPFYVAEKLGLFTKHGLEVRTEECIGGHKCLERLLAGAVDIATVSDSPIMFNSFKHDNFAIVGTFVSSNNDVKLLARRSAGIAHPRDLAGRTIGTVTGASAQYFLDTFLISVGVNPEDVKIIHFAPNALPEALKSGQVDAISVWEPFGFIASQQLGDDLAIFTDPLIYTETFNAVALRAFATQNSAVVIRVLSALKEAITFINKHPRDAQQLLADRLKLEDSFITWIWPDFHFALSLDQSTLLTLEHEARWAIRRNLAPATEHPNYRDYLIETPMMAVSPESVTLIR
ncbi:MAG: ABC transporter substrate-binding protein [Candidatus Competibacter sp.]|nr:ABC transporter substrate-binding protein [Candidatus Competibacter sp.]MDG4584968.1 ABC transporter substrate-binding protein [Candidatus Competibacter sp.]